MGAVMDCVFGYKRLPSSSGNPRPEPRYWPAALKTRMNSVESEEEATEELSLSFSASSSSESLSATSLESGESSSPSKNSLFPWKLRHGPRKKRT